MQDTFQLIKLDQLKEWIDSAKEIVIVAHKSPDGDSIGSSVGLFHYLKSYHKNTTICHPDPAPYFLKWMNGTKEIINAEEHHQQTLESISKADLIFCLDFNTMSRTGQLMQNLLNTKAKKVMIDHHLHPNLQEFNLVFSDSSSCSTSQLIADLIIKLGHKQRLNSLIGEALYCGIMTDTGSFRFSSVQAHTHSIIASLIEAGVQPYKIHEAVFDTNTVDKLRLRSYAINEKMEICETHNTAIISLNKHELKRFNYIKGDTEGLVNVGLSIIGIKKSIFLMEHNGIIKISFRSKGIDNPVNGMASTYFSGGGHANASGGKWEGSLENAIQKVKDVLPEFD